MANIIFEIHLEDMTIRIEECGRVSRYDSSGTLIVEGKCLIFNRIPQLIKRIEAARPKFLDKRMKEHG